MFDEKTVLRDLKKINEDNAARLFTSLFKKSYAVLGLSGNKMAHALSSSERNVRRWKSGEAVPPAANLVLRFLREAIETRVRTGSKSTKSEPRYSKPKAVRKTVPLGKGNPEYPTTCTTFWKQMEPALHSVMEEALRKTKISSATKSEYKGVTRRIYRAAVISAASFLQKKTQPSQHFMKKQGDEAVSKAVAKLFDSNTELDTDSSYNED